VPSDDWEAASTAGTNGSLKASSKMNKSFELLCNALRSIHVPFKKLCAVRSSQERSATLLLSNFLQSQLDSSPNTEFFVFF
jgi:hypothetical protein